MLNGIAPIIIFNFKQLVPQLDESNVPLLAGTDISIPLIPIPIYLDEKLTGIYIDTESKSIDVLTNAQTLPDGKTVEVTQNGINSVVSISMIASKESIGLAVLLAMADIIFKKVTSQEYSITYIHGAITVFGGLLEEITATQSSESQLYTITLKLSNVNGAKTKAKATSAPVPNESSNNLATPPSGG